MGIHTLKNNSLTDQTKQISLKNGYLIIAVSKVNLYQD